NDNGLIVGTASTTGGVLNAFAATTTTTSSITNLNDILGGSSGWQLLDARGINASGHIVGRGLTHDIEHAYLLQNTSISDIPPFSGGTNSFALGLNDSNVVVGASTISSGFTHAFVWRDGELLDLNNYIPTGTGWELAESRGINNTGQI